MKDISMKKLVQLTTCANALKVDENDNPARKRLTIETGSSIWIEYYTEWARVIVTGHKKEKAFKLAHLILGTTNERDSNGYPTWELR